MAVLSSCGGGGGKKKIDTPVVKDMGKKPPPPEETEEDREKARQVAAHEIVPEGSNCLPASLKGSSAPHLELAAIDSDAVICAIDSERERLLGAVACWKVELGSGGLEYQKAAPLPGHGFSVKLHERCARGYCLPKDAKAEGGIAHMVWSPDGSKVAVAAGDDVHLYDTASKARESGFTIRGDKGATGDATRLYWVGDTLFVEATDGGTSTSVWSFKAADGAPGGPLEAIGKNAKPLQTHGGSFVILDKNRVAVAEQGYSTIVSYEIDTGKRAKLVRKLPKTVCKADETEAYWKDQSEKVSAKCKDHMAKNYAHFVGADAVAGKKSLLVLLREPRLGELAVLDAKTLAESKAIKLAWCPEGGQAADDSPKKDSAKKAAPADPKARKGGGDEDPDTGGE